jgi:D-arabinose 1-dehydrogenase-like Zn-dependent alcohol dehydrogenase
LGADLVENTLEKDTCEFLKKETGGMHGVLVTAVSPIVFKQGISVLRRKGAIALNGLPAFAVRLLISCNSNLFLAAGRLTSFLGSISWRTLSW